jgi:hypothetical protein
MATEDAIGNRFHKIMNSCKIDNKMAEAVIFQTVTGVTFQVYAYQGASEVE